MRLFPSLAFLIGASLPALANDGFGGLSATGLTFEQTESVEMVQEDLYIGLDKISVDYVFRNATDQDVTGEVIFPLPPVRVWSSWESSMNLPEDLGNLDIVDFTATVDGQPVQVTIDKVAVIEEPWEENRPLAEQYDTPGRDVTAELARFGIPLTLEVEKIREMLMALSDEDRAAITSAGLAEYWEGDPEADMPPEAYGMWSIVTRYHWTQTFPAGADVRISHSYTNRPPGGLFYWSNPPEEYQTYLVDQYCIDEGTSAALAKAIKHPTDEEFGDFGIAYNIAYVLRTANSWAGPIGKFTLTLDKGDTKNVISLCAEGVTKTGPTTFVIEEENFTPTKDLEILIVQPGNF
ncbi:MAG TPA: DUF4424 family protein [Tabrizicola sp.]|nr:DUF4424 family protein [Tabrizicola sp.]